MWVHWHTNCINIIVVILEMCFSGRQYWKITQLQLEDGFPKNITDLGFPPRIRSVDAALHFRTERYTVFFTGHECWRYTRNATGPSKNQTHTSSAFIQNTECNDAVTHLFPLSQPFHLSDAYLSFNSSLTMTLLFF